MTAVPIRALVLDYGGVLSLPQRDGEVASMARRLGVDVDEFRLAYHAHRDDYDAGLGVDAYWRRVLASLSRRDFTAIADLIEDDIASWAYQREEVWDLARRFRASGARTAMLTNNVPPMMTRLRALGRLETHFDVVLASCDLGFCKPDPRIFRACLDAIAVPASEALFVDDSVLNVEAARRHGMQALLFEDDATVETLRNALGFGGPTHLVYTR
jgi:putative hydrolase of the HAD superfamily